MSGAPLPVAYRQSVPALVSAAFMAFMASVQSPFTFWALPTLDDGGKQSYVVRCRFDSQPCDGFVVSIEGARKIRYRCLVTSVIGNLQSDDFCFRAAPIPNDACRESHVGQAEVSHVTHEGGVLVRAKRYVGNLPLARVMFCVSSFTKA